MTVGNRKFDCDYVAGFLFSENLKRVALIEKQKPNWQRGKLNAIGGKIELDADEFPMEAMGREFAEETGLTIRGWKRFCVLMGDLSDESLDGQSWRVYFYFAIGNVNKIKQVEIEKPIICPTSKLPENVIPNLRWLVPMALSFARKSENCKEFAIVEI